MVFWGCLIHWPWVNIKTIRDRYSFYKWEKQALNMSITLLKSVSCDCRSLRTFQYVCEALMKEMPLSYMQTKVFCYWVKARMILHFHHFFLACPLSALSVSHVDEFCTWQEEPCLCWTMTENDFGSYYWWNWIRLLTLTINYLERDFNMSYFLYQIFPK